MIPAPEDLSVSCMMILPRNEISNPFSPVFFQYENLFFRSATLLP